MGEQSSDRQYPWESYSGYFLHKLSLSTHRPEEDFATPLWLTQGRLYHSSGAEALASLAWLCRVHDTHPHWEGLLPSHLPDTSTSRKQSST